MELLDQKVILYLHLQGITMLFYIVTKIFKDIFSLTLGWYTCFVDNLESIEQSVEENNPLMPPPFRGRQCFYVNIFCTIFFLAILIYTFTWTYSIFQKEWLRSWCLCNVDFSKLCIVSHVYFLLLLNITVLVDCYIIFQYINQLLYVGYSWIRPVDESAF